MSCSSLAQPLSFAEVLWELTGYEISVVPSEAILLENSQHQNTTVRWFQAVASLEESSEGARSPGYWYGIRYRLHQQLTKALTFLFMIPNHTASYFRYGGRHVNNLSYRLCSSI